MTKPKTEKLDVFLKKNSKYSFRLTENQYARLTGLRLPKNSWYLKNRSCLHKHALKYGYVIDEVVDKYIVFRKK